MKTIKNFMVLAVVALLLTVMSTAVVGQGVERGRRFVQQLFALAGANLASTATINWSSTTSPTGTVDLTIGRDGANALGLRNSTNAQTLSVYGTFTNASNYERLSIVGGTTFDIRADNAGSGTYRPVQISGLTVALSTGTSGGAATPRWRVDSSGNLIAVADNTYDFGASAANRARDIHLARHLNIGGDIINAGASMSMYPGNGTNGVLSLFNQGSATASVLLYGSTHATLPGSASISAGGGVRDLIVGAARTLTESSATDVVQLAVASGSATGATIEWSVYATDATDFQLRRGATYIAAVNKAGTETCTVGDIGTPVVAVSAGTLTASTTCSTSPTNAVNFQINAVSSLTQTTLRVTYRVIRDEGTGVITPQ